MSLQKHIKDLIFFYVKTNYNQYLEDHKIKLIPEEKIDSVIESLYDDRKEHLKVFIKESLKKLLKDEYPGDLVILNILLELVKNCRIFRQFIRNCRKFTLENCRLW